MPRHFCIPELYRSDFISSLKRTEAKGGRRDLSPVDLDLGLLRLKIARRFGFCFGVENAIDLAYKAVEENPERRVFLLSEMIHNPGVNNDLRSRGVTFLLDAKGRRSIDFSHLKEDDVVIVPAFGASKEILAELEQHGRTPRVYDATCPFVQRVWKRVEDIGNEGFTVIIHGKRDHEETRATFSHSAAFPSLVIRDMAEAEFVVRTMKGEHTAQELLSHFQGSYTEGFDPDNDLRRIGVVNQTTMLAEETKGIAELFRAAAIELYGEDKAAYYFADTRDTLCYATYENQQAAMELTRSGADIALVVGGYNSSNTSHLVELCETAMTTYFIQDEDELIDEGHIRHFDLAEQELKVTSGWLPRRTPAQIALTAGASCPDRVVEAVVRRLASFFPEAV